MYISLFPPKIFTLNVNKEQQSLEVLLGTSIFSLHFFPSDNSMLSEPSAVNLHTLKYTLKYSLSKFGIRSSFRYSWCCVARCVLLGDFLMNFMLQLFAHDHLMMTLKYVWIEWIRLCHPTLKKPRKSVVYIQQYAYAYALVRHYHNSKLYLTIQCAVFFVWFRIFMELYLWKNIKYNGSRQSVSASYRIVFMIREQNAHRSPLVMKGKKQIMWFSFS